MDQEQTARQNGGGDPNPVDTTGLCLLSLDGGGVRGLSTLHVLKVVMDQLNYERTASGLDRVKPCDIFDLIGGTSTGGLIAIMLGRLEMDVDECIVAYNKLSAGVFAKPRRKFPISFSAKVAPRFDSTKLQSAILKIITSQGLSQNAPFDDGQDRACKTFLPRKDLSLSCTICEAALATSAASGFFDAVQIGARQFVDGALGSNNPVKQVESEAGAIWCDETRDLKPLVKCLVSIGTGNHGKVPIRDRVDKFIAETLVRIATETETTATEFIDRWRKHYDERRFFRFNVEQGLQRVGLAEHDKRGVIETATEQYMAETAQESRVRQCVQNLKDKQSRSGCDLVDLVVKFQTLQLLRHEGVKHPGLRTTEDASISLKPHHVVPFPPDPDFVQRPVIWTWMTDQYAKSGRRIALVGMGGFGKSQLAINFAHKIHDNSPDTSIFWVHGNSKATFEESYHGLADVLALPRRHDPEVDVLALVRDWLQRADVSPWLMIVDNADDVDVFFTKEGCDDGANLPLASYLPKTVKGKILVTSRSLDAAERLTGSGKAILQIPVMEQDQALQLFQKKLDEKAEEAAAIDLVRALDHIPLAVNQAAAYINRRSPRVTPKSYLDEFRKSEKRKDSLLRSDRGDLGRRDGVSNSVVVTWQVTFEQIRRERPRAANLLSLMSCFQAQNIPESMLHDYDDVAADKKVGRGGSDEDTDTDTDEVDGQGDLENDIDVLRGYSLITLTATGFCDMHSLVQFCTRSWISEFGDPRRWKRQFIQLAADHFPSGAFETWKECQRLLPHVEPIVASKRKPKVEGDLLRWSGLLTNVSRYMLMVGEYGRAERLAEEAVQARKDTLGAGHPSTLTSMGNLASTFWNQGRWEEAEKLEVEVMETSKTKLGIDHPDTLTSMGNLASTYRKQGRWEEAEKLEVEVLGTRKTKPGIDHPDTLTSMGNLASTFWNQGRWEKAEKLFVEVMETRKTKLGIDHPDTLTSMANLASTFWNQGRWEEAEKLEVEVMETSKTKLGIDHPDTLTSMANLASTFWNQGRWEEAEELEVEVMETSKTKLGIDHPSTLTIMANLASTYRDQGRWEEAEKLEVEVMETRKTKPGIDHPDTLISMANLAFTWHDQGRKEDAVILMQDCAHLRKKKLGRTHPDTQSSIEALESWRASGRAMDDDSSN